MRVLRRRRRTPEPVNMMAMEPQRDPALDTARAERDAAHQRITELERQLDKADVRAKYLTLGDLDRSLKRAGIENGLNGVYSLGLDGPRGDFDGALEVVIHRYTLDAYGTRHWVAGDEEGAILDARVVDGTKLPGGIAAETRRFLLGRDGSLDPR